MLVVVSPAKALNFDPAPEGLPATQPALMAQTREMRCKKNEKSREMLHEPRKAAHSSLGFDLRTSENVRLRGGPIQKGRRDQQHTMSLFGHIMSWGKVL